MTYYYNWLPYCPNCGDEVEAGNRFCYGCGYNLSRFVSAKKDEEHVRLDFFSWIMSLQKTDLAYGIMGGLFLGFALLAIVMAVILGTVSLALLAVISLTPGIVIMAWLWDKASKPLPQ